MQAVSEEFRGTFGRILVTIAFGVAVSPAQADILSSNRDNCFIRSYDRAHLDKHPAQKVTFIQLTHRPSEYSSSQTELANKPAAGRSYFAELHVRFRDGGEAREMLECAPGAKPARCGLECDGGSFTYSAKKNGSLLIDFRQGWGMQLGSQCGEQEGRLIGSKEGDDRLFRLDPAPLHACR